jgi:tetratricopeptide (TPR) repeat protein
VVAVVAIVSGRAHAQSVNAKATAEQLFKQGKDLAKANQWAEACPKFEASLRNDPTLGTRLNLADCYEHIGKLAAAWGLYRDAIELARKAGDTKRADYAQKHATALEPRLPKLAISVAGQSPSELVVKRDDTSLGAGELGVALYVDPDRHSRQRCQYIPIARL